MDSAVIAIDPLDPLGTEAAPSRRQPRRTISGARPGGFRERRKMLHNVLVRQLPLPARGGAALEAGAIDGDRRPQTLSVDEWLALRAALGALPGQAGP